MGKSVVVVESPAKAKTINNYLGNDFTVLASFGHVRDLPSKDGSVRPDDDFAMTYEIDADSKKPLSAIKAALKGADTLYLATDPDREGEAISWHVLEALKEGKAIDKVQTIHRITFNEITKKAVLDAVAHPRDIDMDLVNAQQARRALDYLVGFTLSPVLWRKLPGSKSAGRVQSVALRLICEREAEIEIFVPREYWDVTANMNTAHGDHFTAKLTEYKGKKLEKFSLTNEAQAKEVEATLTGVGFTVVSVTPKTMRRQPYAPFMTSTLQMEGARKLGFGAKRTMQIAQKLYESGWITYMRTDGITVSVDAVAEARTLIGKEYGAEYVPSSPRMYKTKSKNAQEAHEAIRPTDLSRNPAAAFRELEEDQARLYELIWKRMMASQMEAAVYDQVAVEMRDASKQHALRANGSVLKFDGFLSVYQETIEEDQKENDKKSDDDEADDASQRLPEMKSGENVTTKKLETHQHFTTPPPRYSEASLVKRLEELGIGRPSTYASIISVLVDRGYVTLDKKRFTAASLGRIVTAFLMSFFDRYVEYDFTANMEDTLDEIADGEKQWKEVLRSFWGDFHARIEDSKKLTITEVLNRLDTLLEPMIFGTGEAVTKGRVCPTCNTGRLGLKTGKFGAFLGCSNYPECGFTRQLSATGGEEKNEDGTVVAAMEFPKILGNHPDNNEVVSLRKGPYGVYVQLGESAKPRRTSLPRSTRTENVTLEIALSLLRLPREIGLHPETGETIVANIGRFGPYILHQGRYVNLKGDDDVLSLGMNRAVTLIAEAGEKKSTKAEPLKDLGAHPESGDKIVVLKGKYGPYIKFAKKNITVPKGTDMDSFTLEDAMKLLPATKPKKASAKKAPAAKTPAVKKKKA